MRQLLRFCILTFAFVSAVGIKRRPCRLQTADRADRADGADRVFLFSSFFTLCFTKLFTNGFRSSFEIREVRYEL